MKRIRTISRRSPSAARGLQLAACILAVVGFFSPWIPHKTAALTVTGYELSEFAKFFPQVQGGAVPITRALFLTPLVAVAISLGLLAHRSNARPIFRLAAIAVAVLLGLSALPPVQYILEPSYRVQLALALVGLLLTLLTPLTRQLVQRIQGVLVALVALMGLAPAVWQFILLRPLVAGLYDAPIGPGWGVIVCLVGLGLLFLTGVRDAAGQRLLT